MDPVPQSQPQFPCPGLPPGASAEPPAYGAAGPSTHTPQQSAFPPHLRWKAAAPGTPTIAERSLSRAPPASTLRRRRPGPAPAELARTSAAAAAAAAAVRPRAAPPPDGPGTPPPRAPARRPTHAEARLEGAHAKHRPLTWSAPSAPGCDLSWSSLHFDPPSARYARPHGTALLGAPDFRMWLGGELGAGAESWGGASGRGASGTGLNSLTAVFRVKLFFLPFTYLFLH